MSNPTTVETSKTDVYSMSDEDFLNMPVPVFEEKLGGEKSQPTVKAIEDENTDENEDADEGSDDKSIPSGSKEGKQSEIDKINAILGKKLENEEEELKEKGKEDEDDKLPSNEAESELDEDTLQRIAGYSETELANFENTHNRIFAKFKADGKEIQVKSVDEALQLMQMGVGFYRKSQQLAGHMKTIHALEKAGLTKPEDLGFIIDVFKGDKGAINKLLTDRGFDRHAEDTDTPYTPGNNSVSDSEAQLRVILDENQKDPDFQGMLKTVMSWDTPSKQLFSEHPQLLSILADNYRSGAFQQVMEEVERQRMLGGLAGLSTFHAYRQVVEQFNASLKAAPKKDEGKPAKEDKPKAEAPQPRNNEKDRQNRRKAASPAPSKATTAGADPNFNLYNLSDADLAKLQF